jgi:hypothetical protein
MKQVTLLFVALLLATNFLFAQSQTLSWALTPDNKGRIVCPSTQEVYSAYVKEGSKYSSGCKFQWRVENGYFPLYGNATTANTLTSARIDVVFLNNGSTGKLFLTTTGCDSIKSNIQGEARFDVYLRTLNTETPIANGNYPLQVEKGRRTVTFTAKPVQVPNTGQWGDVSGISTSIFADEYEWTLPSGRTEWQFIGQPATTRFIRTNTPTVDVYVDALNAGAVEVRGVVTACTPNNLSKSLSLPIQRITPTASPISTTAVAGIVDAKGTVECGVHESIEFRSPAPAGLTARRYYWRFTNNTAGYKFVRENGVLKDTAITTTDNVKVLVTPNQTASIAVKAEINYGNNVFEETNEATLTTKINTVSPTLSLSIIRTDLAA